LGYPFDNWTVVNTIATIWLSKEVTMPVRREVHIEASPEEVWEALVTEEGRERWLEEPEREIHVEVLDTPQRLVWWWAGPQEPATRVEFLVVAAPAGTRVIVTETAPSEGVPSFPVEMLVASFALVPA
jgi:uncharacterized protein YndB with AHSA1/START domain